MKEILNSKIAQLTDQNEELIEDKQKIQAQGARERSELQNKIAKLNEDVLNLQDENKL